LQEAGIAAPQPLPPPVLIAHFGGATKAAAVQLAFQLRDAGIGTRLAFTRTRRSLKSQMREANRFDAKAVLIVGESELAEGKVAIRPLGEGEQTLVPLGEVVDWLLSNYVMA
jgi:histidyl-tRNA synthetase